MNWNKYSHNKRNMSRAYAQRKGYHTQLAPSNTAKWRKDKLIAAAKKSAAERRRSEIVTQANETLRRAQKVLREARKGGAA